jgi:SAM-dependent methyltransferase
MSDDIERTKNHYRKVAAAFGMDPKSSMRDQYIRQSEILFFKNSIERFIKSFKVKKKKLKILEIGCGNGHLLELLSIEFPQCEFIGVELTEELAALALKRPYKNARVIIGDVCQELFVTESFDLIISERVLINILHNERRMRAMKNIRSWLKKGGQLFIAESFLEPLNELNHARLEMRLGKILPSNHNRYLTEKEMSQIDLELIPGVLPENYLSTHFYLSRVFHHLICPPGGQKKDNGFVNFLNQALKPAAGNFSPLLFKTFLKS